MDIPEVVRSKRVFHGKILDLRIDSLRARLTIRQLRVRFFGDEDAFIHDAVRRYEIHRLAPAPAFGDRVAIGLFAITPAIQND